MVWTVNRAERMREFAAWGVDAIISDETELLVRSLRSPSDGRGPAARFWRGKASARDAEPGWTPFRRCIAR
jgi:hypothetical protein